jgi:hypothetical protein
MEVEGFDDGGLLREKMVVVISCAVNFEKIRLAGCC